MEKNIIYSKNFEIYDEKKTKLFLSIINKDVQFIMKIMNPHSDLFYWTYNSNYKDLIIAFPILTGCDSLLEISEFLEESIKNHDYRLELNDIGLNLTINFKPFKKKLKFDFHPNEKIESKPMFFEIWNLLIKMAALIPEPFEMDSSILLEKDLSIISNWINPNKIIKLNLLYKGKDHGFDAEVFHAKCDGRAPTLILVESHLRKRFGGVTYAPWDDCSEDKKDENSFLFSLSDYFRYKKRKENSTIFCRRNYGPTFGRYDSKYHLFIAVKCHKNFLSSSELENHGNIPFNTTLAGYHHFAVIALEVYQITIV